MRRKTGRRARRKPVTSVLSNKKPLFSDHVSLYSPDFKSHLSHGQGDRRDHGYRDILPIPGISNDDRTPWFLVPIHHHLTGDPPLLPVPIADMGTMVGQALQGRSSPRRGGNPLPIHFHHKSTISTRWGGWLAW